MSENIDYNPSLCKDYHDTGYCCFGDSCLYIHDRGDYKSGWELEKEWLEEQKQLAQGGNQAETVEEIQDPVCVGCGLDVQVITSCGCLVCEPCAISGFREKQCRGCSAKTDGRMNIFKNQQAK